MSLRPPVSKSFVCCRMDSYLNWDAAGEYFRFDLTDISRPAGPKTYHLGAHVYDHLSFGETHEPENGFLNCGIHMGVSAGTANCFSNSSKAMFDSAYHAVRQEGNLIELPQWRKSTMGYLLNERIRKNPKLGGVVTPEVILASNLPFGKITSRHGHRLAGRFGEFVIKPDIGSRSRGHIYFKVLSGQDLGQAMTEILNEVYDWKPQVAEAPIGNSDKEPDVKFKMSEKLFLRYGAIYNGGINKDVNSGVKFLCDGWVLQERISPLLEFRVFKGYETVDAVMWRPHVKVDGLDIISDDWDQPVTKDSLDTDFLNLLDEKCREVNGHKLTSLIPLSTMIEEAMWACPNFNSIDIGFFANGADLKMVIYEHSSQFSCSDLGAGMSTALFRRWWAINLMHRYSCKPGELVLNHIYMTPDNAWNHLKPSFTMKAKK